MGTQTMRLEELLKGLEPLSISKIDEEEEDGQRKSARRVEKESQDREERLARKDQMREEEEMDREEKMRMKDEARKEKLIIK